jgi:hypothetical protein
MGLADFAASAGQNAMGGGGGGGGIGGALKGVTRLNPIGMVGGALGGVFSALGANKQAKTAAENQNATNAWQHKLNTGTYGTEKMPYYKQGSKMRGWRDTLMRGVMRNKNSGLSKLFGGWDEGKSTAFNAGQDVAQVSNPYDVSGAPPKLKAETTGWQGVVGGGLKGLFG